MAYTQIRPQLKAQNQKKNFWNSVTDFFKNKSAEHKEEKAAEENEFKNALSSFKQSSHNEAKIDEMTDRMNSGKNIVLNSPKSQRLTFNQHIAEDSPTLENFRPKTEAEKQSLSPNGYFRIGELSDERKAMTERKEKATEERLGHALTDDQKELLQAQADDTPVNDVEIPSTALKTVKYNPKTQALYVTFVGSNKKYFYPRVPQKLVEELMQAPSKGEFFIKNIHDVYTLNPGHKASKNKQKNSVVKNYYKKMQKYYKNVMTKGHM